MAPQAFVISRFAPENAFFPARPKIGLPPAFLLAPAGLSCYRLALAAWGPHIGDQHLGVRFAGVTRRPAASGEKVRPSRRSGRLTVNTNPIAGVSPFLGVQENQCPLLK